jgi:hypothetical protein
MVLEKGSIQEFDHPYKLLVNKMGEKNITKHDGLFAEMVLKTGGHNSRHIFSIAYSHFYLSENRKSSN